MNQDSNLIVTNTVINSKMRLETDLKPELKGNHALVIYDNNFLARNAAIVMGSQTLKFAECRSEFYEKLATTEINRDARMNVVGRGGIQIVYDQVAKEKAEEIADKWNEGMYRIRHARDVLDRMLLSINSRRSVMVLADLTKARQYTAW